MPDLLQQLSDHPSGTLWSCGATIDSACRLGFTRSWYSYDG